MGRRSITFTENVVRKRKYKVAFAKGAAVSSCVLGLIIFSLRFPMSGPPKKGEVISEGYGFDRHHFRFGESVHITSFSCSGSCSVTAAQRYNFGPFYYGRDVKGWTRGMTLSEDTEQWDKDALAEFR